ncbi:MAG: SDR family NAD(P)-dependent oxidoreductase [Chloroflexi bacterium]|nr:MAG: SDR family NAD(P)-dependent oxidoreductase [Chloroflexota bacterium]MBL1196125.1 SDR family oxidoreductase [Chloroflexota bacterium]NOH13418.1 SDR family oxidoreductase [Chloroflexota bacterium]
MKTIIVTGANSGIGKEAALNLASSGHRILMLCRDSEKSVQAQKDIVLQSGNQNVFLIPVDLANPASIRTAVDQIKDQYPVIDVLVNNAGIYKVKREETANGVEMSLAVNYLAPFMLSQMLLENLAASSEGRIINVVSELYKNGIIDFENLMMETGYKVGTAYANAKLASVLYTAELARRVSGEGIMVNAMHPGVLATSAFRDYSTLVMNLFNLFLENPKKGGERIAHLATSDELKGVTGKYFYKLEQRELEIPVQETEKSERLWGLAEQLTGLAG